MIQAALNAAQATSENANEAASQAAGELGAQTAMVGAARQRLHALQEQLHGVRIDFEATQAAARKAQVCIYENIPQILVVEFFLLVNNLIKIGQMKI